MSKTLFSPNFSESIVSEKCNLKECLKSINTGLLLACIICSETNKLIGIITDSDIRKALLKGASLDDSVLKWMNADPIIAYEQSALEDLYSICQKTNKYEIPIIDLDGCLIDIFIYKMSQNILINDSPVESLFVTENAEKLDNSVFILAGGLGTRLKEVVSDRPKALAPIGGKPLIEILIQNLFNQGYKNFYISINYLSEKIENFLNSEKFSHLNIQFVKEPKKLGTAGSLGLIKNYVDKPVLVCNADVLTNVNFKKILECHNKKMADITCVVRPFEFVVPYGVATVQNDIIKCITEKPKYNFLINAGIYVLNPNILQQIQEQEYLDMPELIAKSIQEDMRILPYLLHEYWLDIGYPEDYLKANKEFHLHFES